MEKYLRTKDTYKGKMLEFQIDEVLLPNGGKAEREVVKHPGAVAIIPLLPDGKMLFIRQYRYAINEIIYEIPAGKLSLGEDPLTCAKRELKEETGYSAQKYTKLGSIFTVPGFCDEVIHIYLAEQLTEGEQQPDEDEVIEMIPLTEKQVKEMAGDGRICDAKSLAGLFLYGLSK